MSTEVILNDPQVKHFKKPHKRVEVPDAEVSSMYLRVTPTGYKSFVYRYRFRNKVKRYTIGKYPDVSLAKARSRARELSYQVYNGIDPQEVKNRSKQKSGIKTIQDLADHFIAEYLPKKKKTTQNTYKCRIKKITQKLGTYDIDEITRSDVKLFLKKEAEKHPTNANRIQAIFSKMFSYAVNEEFTTNDPTKGIQKAGGKEKPRNPVYSNDDIRTLWEIFDNQEEPMSSLMKFLLVTGQRIGETSRMKWEDIDTENALWIIPREETKGMQTHIVPLSTMAIEILENIHALTGLSNYVFASTKKDNAPLKYFGPVGKRIRQQSKIDSFKIHDLRHIAITGMISLGIDFVHVGKTVAHKGLGKEQFITTRYNHYQYMDEKKDALEKWSRKLDRILNEPEEKRKEFKIGR